MAAEDTRLRLLSAGADYVETCFEILRRSPRQFAQDLPLEAIQRVRPSAFLLISLFLSALGVLAAASIQPGDALPSLSKGFPVITTWGLLGLAQGIILLPLLSVAGRIARQPLDMRVVYEVFCYANVWPVVGWILTVFVVVLTSGMAGWGRGGAWEAAPIVALTVWMNLWFVASVVRHQRLRVGRFLIGLSVAWLAFNGFITLGMIAIDKSPAATATWGTDRDLPGHVLFARDNPNWEQGVWTDSITAAVGETIRMRVQLMNVGRFPTTNAQFMLRALPDEAGGLVQVLLLARCDNCNASLGSVGTVYSRTRSAIRLMPNGDSARIYRGKDLQRIKMVAVPDVAALLGSVWTIPDVTSGDDGMLTVIARVVVGPADPQAAQPCPTR